MTYIANSMHSNRPPYSTAAHWTGQRSRATLKGAHPCSCSCRI
jgi:hypothetical protein